MQPAVHHFLVAADGFDAASVLADIKPGSIAVVVDRVISQLQADAATVKEAGGVFRIEYEDELVWERQRDGGFPDAKTLKRRVRDRLDPERDLGHVDRP